MNSPKQSPRAGRIPAKNRHRKSAATAPDLPGDVCSPVVDVSFWRAELLTGFLRSTEKERFGQEIHPPMNPNYSPRANKRELRIPA